MPEAQRRESPVAGTWWIDAGEAEAGIGPHGAKELERLQAWLYPEFKRKDIEYRIAPSIVCRSESELFGVSMPRFAYRAYLRAGSFVNARRLATFEETIEEEGNETLVECLRNLRHSCIADSLLTPPSRFAGSYHIIDTDLGEAYGEDGPLKGVPFVNHVPLGGGLCAQAVCMMATLLLHEHSAEVHGMSEITKIVASLERSGGKGALELGGLSLKRIASYLSEVGLSAHIAEYDLKTCDNIIVDLRDTFRSYILSDMPIVVMVDIRKMMPLYIRRGIIDQRHRINPREFVHTCLIVGCAHNSDRYLINDPYCYPFVDATIREIYWAGVERLQFAPVVPAAVRLGLMGNGYNIIDMALGLQKKEQYRQKELEYGDYDGHGHFRLVDLDAPIAGIRSRLDIAKSDETLAGRLKDGRAQNRYPRWIWLQRLMHPSSVWIWDATGTVDARPGISDKDRYSPLVKDIYKDSGSRGWVCLPA